MKNRIVSITGAIMLMLGLVLVAAPANAVTDTATCTYDHDGVNRVNSDLTVTRGSDGRFTVTGSLWNDGANREWDWEMKHDGSISASGTSHGGFSVTRTMVDFLGPDDIVWIVKNEARTVRCESRIIMS